MEAIYFKEDLIDAYSKRRPKMPKREIRDIIDCTISFIRSKVDDTKTYAVEIPHFGTLYTKYDFQKEKKGYITDMTKNTLLEDMFVEGQYTEKTHPIFAKTNFGMWYPDKSREEIQDMQNE